MAVKSFLLALIMRATDNYASADWFAIATTGWSLAAGIALTLHVKREAPRQ